MKGFLLTVLTVATFTVVSAQQSVVVVDSEKIFKSIPEYNVALEKIDRISKKRQLEVDSKFAEVERIFNEYAKQRGAITPQGAQQIETFILQKRRRQQSFKRVIFRRMES